MRSACIALRGSVFAVALLFPTLVSFGEEPSTVKKSFREDLKFLRDHTPIVLLESAGAAVAIAPEYQGRVMTSTVDQ